MDADRISKISRTFVDEQFSPGEPHIILPGQVPVMISAPHIVGQIRHGRHKLSESHTGVLAQLLHEDPGYHVIMKTRNLFDDANYDEKSFYRDDLVHYINSNNVRLLLDIHIMNPTRPNTIEMATGELENIQGDLSIIDQITEIALDKGLTIATDHLFFALNPHCIAAHVAKHCGIPAIQVEINWRDLDVENGSNKRFMEIYQFLRLLHGIVDR